MAGARLVARHRGRRRADPAAAVGLDVCCWRRGVSTGWSSAGNGLYALYVPPAAIPPHFSLVFARSLRPDRFRWSHASRVTCTTARCPTIWWSTRATSRSCGVASAPRCSVGRAARPVRDTRSVVADDERDSLCRARRGVHPRIRLAARAIPASRTLRDCSSICGASRASGCGSECRCPLLVCSRSTHSRRRSRSTAAPRSAPRYS